MSAIIHSLFNNCRKKLGSTTQAIQSSAGSSVSNPFGNSGNFTTYDETDQKKKDGELDEFDPSETYVHPKHRVSSFKIKISKKQHREYQLKHSPVEYIASGSDGEGGSQEGGDDDDYAGAPKRQQKQRAAKKKGLKQLHLPFSPRKTRKGARAIVVEDDSEVEAVQPELRRGTRAKAGSSKNYKEVAEDDDYYDERDGDEDEDEDATPERKPKGKKKPKKAVPKPEYGRIRDIADMEDPDDEDASLRAHRDYCEKCKKSPAHILVKKAKGKRGKKKRKNDDEFEETEEEHAVGLGGWVRW